MKLQIGKRIRAIFSDAPKQLATVMPKLRELKTSLGALPPEPLDAIVKFFDLVSKWHDRGLRDVITAFEDANYGQYTPVLTVLRTLEMHFENAGRDKYGMNRTERGETVTANRVYLGNIWGLWTKTVRFWRARKDEPKGGWGFSGMEDFNTYDVISVQAREFMESHITPMCELIAGLDRFSQQAQARAA